MAARSEDSKFRALVRRVGNRHRHKPLTSPDCTRMLYLHGKNPASPEDIRAELIEVKFEKLEPLPYVALSYTWGDATSPERIFIHRRPTMPELAEGITAQDLLQQRMVGRNLYLALLSIQPEEESEQTLVWIDALCINQEDSKEKAQQLAHINLVYERADSVLIWLGTLDERRERAMDFVTEVIEFSDVKSLANNKEKIEDWQSLVELMSLPWFSRRWIIQELALGERANVRCGKKQVLWRDMRDAISMMARHFDDICSLFKREEGKDNDYYYLGDIEVLRAMVLVNTIHNIFRRDSTGTHLDPMQGLEYLVTTLSKFETSDPRDTITTVRNIAKEAVGSGALEGEDAPPLPYSDHNTTLLEIYIDFVRWIYRTSRRIDIICHKWALPEKKKRPQALFAKEDIYPQLSVLPTWIQTVPQRPPTWQDVSIGSQMPRFERRLEGDSLAGTPGNRPYNCSLSQPSEVNFPDLPKRGRKDQPNQPSVSVGPPAGVSSAANDTGKKRKRQDEEEQSDGQEPKQRSHSRERLARIRAIRDLGIDLPVNTNLIMADRTEMDINTSSESTPRDPSFNTLTMDTSLSIEGIQIGVISKKFERTSEGIIRQEVLQALWPNYEGDVPDRLWRALIAERAADGNNPPPTYWRACKLIMHHHLTNHNLNTRDLLRKDHKMGDLEKEYLKRVHTVTFNRSFFEADSTLKPHVQAKDDQEDNASGSGNAASSSQAAQSSKGKEMAPEMPVSNGTRNSKRKNEKKTKEVLQGFGPGECENKDIVCVLFGCSVPVILRPSDETMQSFTLVGECYVYGMMDGEALRRWGDSLDRVKRACRIL